MRELLVLLQNVRDRVARIFSVPTNPDQSVVECIGVLSQRTTLQMSLTKQQKDELACTCAALLLHDAKLPIDSAKIKTLAKAANIDVEAHYPFLFAKVLAGKNVSDLLKNVGSAPAAATAAPVAAPKEEKKEEKKKEEKKKVEEPEDDGGDLGFGGLF